MTQPSPQETTWSVRPLTEDDLPKVVAIEKRVQPGPAPSHWTRDHFASELTKSFSHAWVLTDDETDEEVAAYLVFWTLETVHVLNLGVDRAYQRRGYAKKLIRLAGREGIRRGIDRMTLEVRKSNLTALELYQSLGFTIRRVRKSAYSNGEDAYEMELSLHPTEPGGAEVIEF